MLGAVRRKGKRFIVKPTQRGNGGSYIVLKPDSKSAEDGDLVEFLPHSGNPGYARIIRRMGPPDSLRSLSDIAIQERGLPEAFSDAALEEASSPSPQSSAPRVDLRHLGFITIDPDGARDRDDAVFACPCPDASNPGGHAIWVAIADAAHFVRPDSALCREARRRGNSTYFPDMVLPMLPAMLSGDACSLNEGLDRFCLAVRMTVDRHGRKLAHEFMRATIRSRASLSYRRAQSILDGGEVSDLRPILADLKDAHLTLKRARDRRQPLNLDLQERGAQLSADGKVIGIRLVERLECHEMIEEFMVSANVSAAETLHDRRTPHLRRIHDCPDRESFKELAETLKACGLTSSLPSGLTTKSINRLLLTASERNCAEIIGPAVLRAMKRAVYSASPGSHFGLNLRRYAHFTSPIRRYADLVTHRALIAALGMESGVVNPEDSGSLEALAGHLSACERRSAAAERQSLDRFAAKLLGDSIDCEFSATVMSVLRFGAFVRLDGTGAEGLVPISRIGRSYFFYDSNDHSLTSESTGQKVRPGQRVKVRLTETDAASGQITFRFSDAPARSRKWRHARRRGQNRRRPA